MILLRAVEDWSDQVSTFHLNDSYESITLGIFTDEVEAEKGIEEYKKALRATFDQPKLNRTTFYKDVYVVNTLWSLK